VTRLIERLTITIEGEHVSGVKLGGVEPGHIVGIQLHHNGQPIDFSDRDFTAVYELKPISPKAVERPGAQPSRATQSQARKIEEVRFNVGGALHAQYKPLRKVLDYSDIEDIREFPLQCMLCPNISPAIPNVERQNKKCEFDHGHFEARTFLRCDKCVAFTATAPRAETFYGKKCPECSEGNIIPYWPKM
jgi:hypothetical protein